MQRLSAAIVVLTATTLMADPAKRSVKVMFPPTASDDPPRLAQHVTLMARTSLRPKLDACEVHPISCDTLHYGTLEVGDCTADDGTYVDFVEFYGRQGDFIGVSLWPLDASYTEIILGLIPPSTDASKTPFVIRGPGGVVWYVLSSSGGWVIGIGADHLFSSGRYAVAVQCDPDPDSSLPQNCVGQQTLCGQMSAWELTSQSCRFGAVSSRLYASHSIYGRTGDTLDLEMVSDDFVPLFGVYQNGELLASSSGAVNGVSRMSYYVVRDGWYEIIATSTEDLEVGLYLLNVECGKSGCMTPLITNYPQAMTVNRNDRAVLSVEAKFVGPTTYEWFDVTDFPRSLGRSQNPTLVTEPITSRRAFLVKVENPCGYHESGIVHVTPRVAKRRAVGR